MKFPVFKRVYSERGLEKLKYADLDYRDVYSVIVPTGYHIFPQFITPRILGNGLKDSYGDWINLDPNDTTDYNSRDYMMIVGTKVLRENIRTVLLREDIIIENDMMIVPINTILPKDIDHRAVKYYGSYDGRFEAIRIKDYYDVDTILRLNENNNTFLIYYDN
jgi:hypothetical protein